MKGDVSIILDANAEETLEFDILGGRDMGRAGVNPCMWSIKSCAST